MVEHKMEFMYVTVLMNFVNSSELVLNVHLKILWEICFRNSTVKNFHIKNIQSICKIFRFTVCAVGRNK